MTDETTASDTPFSFAAAKPKGAKPDAEKSSELTTKKRKSAAKATQTRQRKPDPVLDFIRAMQQLNIRQQKRVMEGLQKVFG